GRVNFGLPDLRGKVPIHFGDGFTLGEKGGEPAHTLTQQEMPQHIHFGQVRTVNATTGNPTNNFLAGVPTFAYRTSISNLTTLSPPSVTNFGGSQAHLNMQPYL